jgi:hypothetical protein
MSSNLSSFPNQDLPILPDTSKESRFPPSLVDAARFFPDEPALAALPVMASLPELMSDAAVPVPTAQSNWGSDLPSIPVLHQPLSESFAMATSTSPAFPSFPNHLSPTPAFDELPSTPVDSPFAIHEPAPVSAPAPRTVLPPLEREHARLDYTDKELLDVLRPLVEGTGQRSLYQSGAGIDTYLEPLLRATIRRALAEHSPTQSPFREPGFLDRVGWRLAALFSSRTYEEIHFEKTRRFRVEEVYLLEKINLSMISFASSDPARHASAKRVHATVRRLADGALDKEGTIRLFYDLPEGRHAVVREGRNALLIAVVLGTPGDALRIDLDYTLRRIEERFGARFDNLEDPLLLSIQPHLEDCLLIVAPSSNH